MRSVNRLSRTARLIRLAAVTAMLPIAIGSFTSQAVAEGGGECPEEHLMPGCIECSAVGKICSWKEGGTTCHGTQECRECPTNPAVEATYCILDHPN